MKINDVEVTAIEYRAGEGLVVRAAEMDKKAADALRSDLDTVLRSSPCRLLHSCCDTAPDADHEEGCEA